MLPGAAFLSCVLAWRAVSSAADIKSLSAVDSCAPALESTEIGDRATCTFQRMVDKDATRMPPEIPTVKCNCCDTVCSETGDFRCQEVKEKMVVSYLVKGSSAVRNQTVEVTTACVCAANRSVQAPGGGERPSRIYENGTSIVGNETTTVATVGNETLI
ncbi:unnamed protein product [Ixodes persulcatus]